MKNTITVTEKYLTFSGLANDAWHFVEDINQSYASGDMPKVLSDFLFAIEVQLQQIGFLDLDFNKVKN